MLFSNKSLLAILITLLVLFVPSIAAVQGPEIEAVRAAETVTVDGLLDEPVWQREGYSDLIQRDPIEWGTISERTDVLIAYDEAGLYVAGTCYHTGPDTIIGGLARRDETVESDWFWFWIDPNYDRQNGYGFALNPNGSMIDQRNYRDILSDDDWDAVWQAAAVRQRDRWTFEMFIPFDQLRFDRQDEYVWGVNFKRYIIANAEHNYFVMVPKAESGFVSRFGRLIGLNGIEPPPRLFVSPYAMGQINDVPGTSGHPFASDMRYGRNLGLDVKYGLTGNLTLDLAINPDFGQAEVDPAVINLSAFETFYSEKRTFFLEGSDIFSFGANPTGGVWGCYWYHPTMFYSRRIGRRPISDPAHDGDVYAPDQTTILGAAKISGKINNWSIGSVNAVTQEEFARVDSAGERFEDTIEPRAFYGVYRGVGEFNEGDQGLGFLLTYVQRNQDIPRLRADNNDRALMGGLDGWAFLGQKRKWAFMGQMAWSQIAGSEERMVSIQRSSTHYYQRPDYEAVSLDSNRTKLEGWMGRFGLRTVGGNAHFQTALGILSPGFNVNDLGYSSRGNLINWHVVGGYQWLEPTSWYRGINLNFMTSRNFDFDGNQLFAQVWHGGNFQRLDYIAFHWNVQITPDGLDPFGTRGGPMIAYPGFTYVHAGVSTDSRKAVSGGGCLSGQFVKDGSFFRALNLSTVFRLAASLKLTVSTTLWADDVHQQWVDNVDDSLTTWGQHYVFGTLDQEEVSATLRLDWGITPQLSLQTYIQPFFGVGAYSDFKELARARS
ncbi:MAG: carbohydrate binding family 9 domain-containing protein, partial [Fidelibacterota bacterium]